MTVNEYRAKKKRCRTCEYAKGEYFGWTCEAKNKRSSKGLEWTDFCGMFCPLYRPRQMQEAEE